jgi:hypothetical protein
MDCPNCGLNNPTDTRSCDCGYNFETHTRDTTIKDKAGTLLFNDRIVWPTGEERVLARSGSRLKGAR